jgi:hypothetical protein
MVDTVETDISLRALAMMDVVADICGIEAADAARAHSAGKALGIVHCVQPPVGPQRVTPLIVIQLRCAE